MVIKQNQTAAEATGAGDHSPPQNSRAPVFIVGCPRSGTSFLYHLLLSAGGFAEFHTQMNVYDVLEPIYGDLGVMRNKKAALEEWLRSKAGRLSGLEHGELQRKILQECHSASDFLQIIMEAIAQRQGVERWIDSTPTNIPHMLRIHRDLPDALFVHIIRDPRDVALSLDRRGWTRPLPWDKSRSLLAAGLYWEWIVRKGRSLGRNLPQQYIEVRYEDLVQEPKNTLDAVGEFLSCELNYDWIRKRAVGSVKDPLTAFPEDLRERAFNPVGRWKQKFPADQLRDFEALVGRYMEELGYQPSTAAGEIKPRLRHRAMRALYGSFHPLKQWAKTNTPLSRWMVNYSEILIDK